MDARETPRVNSSQPQGMMMGPTNAFAAAGAAAASALNNSIMPPSSAGMMQGMRLSFNPMSISPASKPPMDTANPLYPGDGASGVRQGDFFNMSEPVKKKRGRPRKYGPDGSMSLALSPLSANSGYSNNPASDPSGKRRGRPPGSGKKKQLEALGSSGADFTPHVITVQAGEDVASKIFAFSQQGSRTVCILSAIGAIDNVTFRQPASSGGTVTYEGRFEILSLSGSLMLTEDGGTRSRSGGLSVTLAGPDGRVIGGGVAGMLKAAAPVLVTVGTFIAERKKGKSEPLKREPPASAPMQIPGFGASLTPSDGTSSGSSDDPGSPMNHSSHVAYNNSGQHMQYMHPSLNWPNSANQMRLDSDLKVMPN